MASEAAPHSVTCICSTVGVFTRGLGPAPLCWDGVRRGVVMSPEGLADQCLAIDRDRGDRVDAHRRWVRRPVTVRPGEPGRRVGSLERDPNLLERAQVCGE